ncbi:hypothetical protein SprV_0902744300 [Sparganum proliferum]
MKPLTIPSSAFSSVKLSGFSIDPYLFAFYPSSAPPPSPSDTSQTNPLPVIPAPSPPIGFSSPRLSRTVEALLEGGVGITPDVPDFETSAAGTPVLKEEQCEENLPWTCPLLNVILPYLI